MGMLKDNLIAEERVEFSNWRSYKSDSKVVCLNCEETVNLSATQRIKGLRVCLTCVEYCSLNSDYLKAKQRGIK